MKIIEFSCKVGTVTSIGVLESVNANTKQDLFTPVLADGDNLYSFFRGYQVASHQIKSNRYT